MRDDLYSDGREVMVDSEQAEDLDDTSEHEKEVNSDERSFFSFDSIFG